MARKDAKSDSGSRDERAGTAPPGSYFIDPERVAESGRSLPLLVASRRCYECQQADYGDDSALGSDHESDMERIAEHCSDAPDYLLPDTPIKEAIFRVLLAANNGPQTPEAISKVLSDRWVLTAYPRDVSETVIRRLLDNSDSYSKSPVAEAEG